MAAPASGTPRRLKSISLIAGALLSGLVLLAWTGEWFSLTLTADFADSPRLAIGGDVAAPALIALALAGLAPVAALAIAGPIIRVVLAVLEALIGVTVLLSAYAALSDPAGASASAVTAATGVSGQESVAALVGAVETGAWPWLAVVAGVLMIGYAAVLMATVARWPASTSKYQAVRMAPAGGDSRVSDWDSLTTGDDPTTDRR
jgi:hypothetical protein